MLIKDLQPVTRSLKQTVLETSSSSTVGRAPANQPDQTVLHLYASTRVVGIFVPAAPTKRYHPTGSWLSHGSAEKLNNNCERESYHLFYLNVAQRNHLRL